MKYSGEGSCLQDLNLACHSGQTKPLCETDDCVVVYYSERWGRLGVVR